MDLLTAALRARLYANCGVPGDHVPVVKFFSPLGAATWLFTELCPDGDTLFGLCDLGFGCPELGYASLAELAAVRLPLGLGIERDLAFAPTHPLSVFAAAARDLGRITEYPGHLARAAERLAHAARASPPDQPPEGG